MTQGFYLVRPFRNVDDERVNEYMAWLDSEVLQSRLDKDPALLPLVGQTVRKVLITDRLSIDDPEEVRKLWRIVASEVVRAMPEAVRASVMDDERARKELGISFRAAVAVGHLEFPEQEFWRAAAEAVSGGTARLSASDKAAVSVKLETPDAEDLTLVFESPNGKTYRVGDPIHELLQPGPHRVPAFLQEHRDWLDLPGNMFEQEASEIAAMTDPIERVRAVLRRRNASVANFYGMLAGKIGPGKPFSWRDLMPPSAEALRRYLRLSADHGRSFADRMAEAANLLLEEGLDAAFDRLSGLPLPLPAVLLNGLEALGADGARTTLKRWQSNSSSPVARSHLLRAASHVRAKFGTSLDLAPVLDEFVGAVQQDGSVDAFLALLKASAGILEELPGSDEWSLVERLAITWTHASRVFHIFRSAAAPHGWMVEAFKRDSDDRELSFRLPCWTWLDDIAAPESVGRGQLILRGLWYGLGDDAADQLGTSRVDALRSLGVQRVGERNVPVLEFLRDPALAGDLLGSFLAGPGEPMLAELVGTEAAEWYSSPHLEAVVAAALGRCASSDAGATDWLQLEATIHQRQPYPSVQRQLDDALVRADFVSIRRKHGELWVPILRFAGRQAARSQDSTTRTAMADHLVALASDMGAQNPAPPPQSDEEALKAPFRDVFFLMEVAMRAARVDVDATVNAEGFASLARRIGQSWPSCKRVVESLLGRLIDRTPFESTGPLWRELLELRATN